MKKFTVFMLLLPPILVAVFVLNLYLRQQPLASYSNPSTVPGLSANPGTSMASSLPAVKVGRPTRLSIPKLQVDANIEAVGEDPEGRMDVPSKVNDVAWFKLGFKPGDKGSAVIDGHFDTVTGAPAVFYYISKLSSGDQIIVTDEFGKQFDFDVTQTTTYPFDKLPLQDIFASTDKPRLNLITCSGIWDAGSKNYSTRTVVYSELSLQ